MVEGESKSEKITEATEEAVTNALIKVTREGVKKVYFTENHNEKDYEATEATGFSKIWKVDLVDAEECGDSLSKAILKEGIEL